MKEAILNTDKEGLSQLEANKAKDNELKDYRNKNKNLLDELESLKNKIKKLNII